MSAPITLYLARSSAPCGLCLERADGQRATIDEALAEGFTVRPDDAPALLTLAARFVETRDEFQK